ncbi:MAG: DUF5329 family protein [Deltaproteobacteria bacterium]|nr:DUF5329 family protein [Deltaproteobacteria bacterium]
MSEQINHLLKFVETSRCAFIRNGTERDSEAAARHIQKKYDYFRSDIHSAEDFIELAATKSLLTGRPYLVRCGARQAIPAADWLRAQLAAYRKGRK